MTPRQADRAVDIVTGLVVASVGIALAGLTWRLAGASAASAPATLAAPATPAPGPDATPALALAPFGRASGADARMTGLPLELKGVILATPRAASTAFIAPTGGTPLSYAIGAPVPGGATVEEIALDHVVLRVGAGLERLAFPTPGASAPPAPGQVATFGPSDAPPPPQAIAAPPAGPSLLDGLGAVPVEGGLRVGQGQSPMAQRAGLQPGDVVQTVNGQPAAALAADRARLAGVMAAGTAQVEVVRDGKRLTLSFPTR